MKKETSKYYYIVQMLNGIGYNEKNEEATGYGISFSGYPEVNCIVDIGEFSCDVLSDRLRFHYIKHPYDEHGNLEDDRLVKDFILAPTIKEFEKLVEEYQSNPLSKGKMFRVAVKVDSSYQYDVGGAFVIYLRNKLNEKRRANQEGHSNSREAN